MTQEFLVLINGKWVKAKDHSTMDVINPASGEIVGKAPNCKPQDVNLAVEAAAKAFPQWKAKTIAERSKLLLKLSQLIMANQKCLAQLETLEHGSPIRKTMNFDVPLCAEQLEFFAGTSRAMTGDTFPVGPWCVSFSQREPLGVVGLITPWNFPVLMVGWKIGAALVTGNTCVIKPPSIAPLSTLKLAELAIQAGFPKGVINVVTGKGNQLGEALVRHPFLAKIDFNGPTETGKRVMRVASDNITQVGLELGGKNSFIVLKDADIDTAAEGAVFASFFNSGQVCSAASRFYIHQSIYEEFTEKFVKQAGKLKMGDPMNFDTNIGPVVSKSHKDQIEAHIRAAQEQGAKLLLGGQNQKSDPTEKGFFVAPTIFGDCSNDMALMHKKIFGPVVGLVGFDNEDQAIKLANDSDYGLAASIWTKNTQKALYMAQQIQAGTVWINEHLTIFAETPLGGFKQSGWGKDLSIKALEEYTQLKHIYVDISQQGKKNWHDLLK